MRAWRQWFERQLPLAAGGLGLAAAALVAWTLQQRIVHGAPGRDWESWLVFGLGGLAAVLLAALLSAQRRERQHAEEEAWRANSDLERMALAARKTFDAVVITDAARRITWVNAGFERITGWRFDEVLGLSPGALLQAPETDRATIARLRAALDALEPFHGELLNRHREGRLYWIEVSIQPMHDAQGMVSGFLAVQRDVTAAREATRALAAERQRLQRIIDATQAGTWEHDLATGENLNSRRYAEMLGYSLEEFTLPAAPSFMQLVHPDDAPAVERARNAHLHGLTREYGCEFRMRHKAGHWVWVKTLGQVVERDARGEPQVIAGIHLDITERRDAQAEMERSAQVLRGAIDAIDEAFVLYDPDDRLLLCNEKYREVYSRSADQIRPGARFEDLLRHGLQHGQFPAAAGREEAWLAERMAQHRSGTATIVQKLEDGRTVRIVERLTPDGCLVGFRVDISELVRATEAAERASGAKTEFIATISHELRTPLQSIIGFSELGQHFAAGHAQFRPMFDDIHAGGRRMLTLVNALLDVSKIEAGGGGLNVSPCDLAALTAAVVHELHPQLGARSLAVELPQPLPALPVRVNAFRMKQVLRNVLANAVRFAPEGSTLEIEGGLHATGGAREAWLSIRDHGPGIPQDELQSIFEPFVQSSRTSDGAGGSGLGLTICHKIMQAQGGSIEAANAEGGGAVFTMRLPSGPAPLAMAPWAAPLPVGDVVPA